MKIAVLILAHKNPKQIELLVNSLCYDFDVYVHIDKKCNFPIDELHKRHSNTVFFSEFDISWGGANMMLATISLFKIAAKKKYDHYIFISGQDFPLYSNAQIVQRFQEIGEVSLFAYEQLPRNAWGLNGGFDRFQLFWELDTCNLFYKYFIKIVRKFQLMSGLRRSLYPMRNYYGSSSWCTLHKNMMEYVLDFVQENPSFIKKMRYSKFADEIWLATIALNSPHTVIKQQISFVDWGSGPEYPRILRIEDFSRLKSQSCLFARKFDIEIDSEIINQIIENR